MPLHRFLLASFTSLSVLGVAAQAHAEAGTPLPRCYFFSEPAGSATVPANAPALFAQQLVEYGPAALYTGAASAPTLSGTSAPALTAVADTRSKTTTLFVPSGALTASSTYTLGYHEECKAADQSNAFGFPRNDTASFTATAASPLPTTLGTVAVGAYDAATNSAPVTVKPSPELEAYLQLSLFELAIGGKVIGQTGYGELAGQGHADGSFTFAVGALGGGVSFGEANLVPACNGSAMGHEVTETFELRAHVAGAASDPTPVSFDAIVQCPVPVDPNPPPSPDAGRKATQDSGLAADSGIDPMNWDGTPPRDDASGGCQVGAVGGAASGFAALLPLAALALARLGRRRRRA